MTEDIRKKNGKNVRNGDTGFDKVALDKALEPVLHQTTLGLELSQ